MEVVSLITSWVERVECDPPLQPMIAARGLSNPGLHPMPTSYDYSTRKGLRPISWNDFHGLVKALVVTIAPWQPEIILPVGRGGNYPGTLLAHILQVEVFPVRLTRRENDVVVREEPIWMMEPPSSIAGHRILVVDEVASTGRTLQIVRDKAIDLGASEVRSAVLYAHASGSNFPDYIGLITDDLIMNPWDREIFQNGEFLFHPEYIQALAEQGLTAESSLLIPASPFTTQKTADS